MADKRAGSIPQFIRYQFEDEDVEIYLEFDPDGFVVRNIQIQPDGTNVDGIVKS